MTATQAIRKEPTAPASVWALPVLLAWLIPGAGHFMLKRQGRGALVFASVILMFISGLLMRGAMFQLEKGDLLTTVINYGGYIANLAAGVPFLLSKMLGYSQADVAGHIHDYGTKFLATSGLLNILAIVDVYEIAVGKKD